MAKAASLDSVALGNSAREKPEPPDTRQENRGPRPSKKQVPRKIKGILLKEDTIQMYDVLKGKRGPNSGPVLAEEAFALLFERYKKDLEGFYKTLSA